VFFPFSDKTGMSPARPAAHGPADILELDRDELANASNAHNVLSTLLLESAIHRASETRFRARIVVQELKTVTTGGARRAKWPCQRPAGMDGSHAPYAAAAASEIERVVLERFISTRF
jgi:hypothetical protein